ncbi:hypothetical protein ACA910_015105 [Epithemia clementina (nom. ined.)]
MILPTTSRLARIVIMVRGSDGLSRATEFYSKALGLTLMRGTEEWTELTDGNIRLHLSATYSESQLATGNSPMLTFNVENMDQRIAACVQAGAHLDGSIQYPAHGKVAAMRTPDGVMIGLYEPNDAGAVNSPADNLNNPH